MHHFFTSTLCVLGNELLRMLVCVTTAWASERNDCPTIES